MFEHQVTRARQTALSIRKNLEAMGEPDRNDHDRLAEHLMLQVIARIYENADTNHFGGRDRYGHVGAAIVIPGIDEIVFYQSKQLGFGWYHAERGARRVARRLCRKHGMVDLPSDCILVVTMEPCVGDVPGRIGECCSNLVQATGFQKVYIGSRDWTLRNPETDMMPIFPDTWSMVSDPYIRQVAKELFDFFGDWYIMR